MIRAFIAVEIAPETVARIAAAIDELKSKLPAVRWVAPGSFHLTVKFLGDIEATQVDSIGAALEAAIAPFPRCTINAKGLGVFPGRQRPKILWVGFHGDELAQLAAAVESALLPLGFSAETRGFTPHLTIGRWRQSGEPAARLKEVLNNWRDHDFGATNIDRVILFHSELKPTGAIYSRLKIIDLNHS